MTLKPPVKPIRKHESWVKIGSREKLEAALKEVDDSIPQIITFRPCLGCDRFPIGAYFSKEFIQLTYNKADKFMNFQRIDAMTLESSGSGGGGGAGGGGGG